MGPQRLGLCEPFFAVLAVHLPFVFSPHGKSTVPVQPTAKGGEIDGSRQIWPTKFCRLRCFILILRYVRPL